jgi:hypothetical protein
MPSFTESESIAAGERVVALAETHRAAIERRLAAGLIEKTKAAVAELRDGSGEKSSARADKRSSTVSQNEALAAGATIVSRVRRLIRTGAPEDKALWRAFGVGKEVTESVKAVSNALTTIIDGFAKYEAKATATGVLADDITEAQAALASLTGADRTQEGKKVSAKAATARVKVLRDQLTRDLRHIVSVAAVSLPPSVGAQFESALPKKKAGRARPTPS